MTHDTLTPLHIGAEVVPQLQKANDGSTWITCQDGFDCCRTQNLTPMLLIHWMQVHAHLTGGQ